MNIDPIVLQTPFTAEQVSVLQAGTRVSDQWTRVRCKGRGTQATRRIDQPAERTASCLPESGDLLCWSRARYSRSCDRTSRSDDQQSYGPLYSSAASARSERINWQRVSLARGKSSAHPVWRSLFGNYRGSGSTACPAHSRIAGRRVRGSGTRGTV